MGSKVTPYTMDVPPSKENNYLFKKGMNLIRQMKLMLILQMLMGINRLFLLEYRALKMRLSYLHTSFLFVLALLSMIISDGVTGRFTVFKEISIIEYLTLIFISSFTYKETLRSVFENLASFDEMLNISKEVAATIQIKREIFWMTSSLMYCIAECFIFVKYLNHTFSPGFLMIYITIFAHDSEQIFFVTLIRTILVRVYILKAHIAKAYNTEKNVDINEHKDSLELLANNAQLDTTAMHRAYELLHKCAELLSSAMSFPMIVMLFTSGLSTTILLKKFFQVSQENNKDEKRFNATLIYTAVRCIKYTLLVIVPSYYASITSRQVMNIRTMIHNAVNTFSLEKIERRKIKAFFQLTQDNEFTYALWGVIRLSMSLPLSYASLCTTYLVITIQFSKFID